MPEDIDALRAIITAQAEELAVAKADLKVLTLEVEKLKIQLARLRRMAFGQSSEKIAREIEQLELADDCPACGGVLRAVGEDITEILDYVPGHFQVIRHIRPALPCRTCESMVHAPMPSLPVPRGLSSLGLVARVLVSKYCDHLPLYRQSQIYAREMCRWSAPCWPAGSARRGRPDGAAG